MAVLENGRFTLFNRIAGLAHAYIRSIAEGKSGRFWVGTENGLFEISGGNSASFDTSNGMPDGRIRALQEDPDGVLWAGTATGLLRFDGKNFEAVGLGESHANVPVTAMYQDPDGTLWMGSGIGGLYRRDGDHFSMVAEPGRLGSGVGVMTRDRDGNLWIGTREEGLIRWRNRRRFSTFLDSNLFATSDLRSLLEDNEGSLWVGTYGVGLLRMRDAKFASAGETEGLLGNVTWTVAPRSAGGVWVGSDGGLSSYADGRFQHIAGPHGHENVPVRAVLEDRRSSLWVGTEGAGAYRLDQHGMESCSSRQNCWPVGGYGDGAHRGQAGPHMDGHQRRP